MKLAEVIRDFFGRAQDLLRSKVNEVCKLSSRFENDDCYYFKIETNCLMLHNVGDFFQSSLNH